MALARLSYIKDKLLLGLTSTTHDNSLKLALEMATQEIEGENGFTARTLTSTAYTDKIITRNESSMMDNRLYPIEWPVTAVSKLEFWDTSTEDYVEETATYYQVIDERWIDYPKLGQETNATYSTFPKGQNRIRITYTAGYVTTNWATLAVTEAFAVPRDLEHAVGVIATLQWLDGQGGDSRLGISSVSNGVESYATQPYIDGYPKEIYDALKRYRRKSI